VNVTTTAGETFTKQESEYLAALIHKRFGWNDSAAAAAWRRLLENDCDTNQFLALALMANSQVRRGFAMSAHDMSIVEKVKKPRP
jgi:hypothetical protein